MIFETEQRINLIDQLYYTLDLVLDLLRSHEDMGVVLGEAAHPHQPMQLSGFLMAMHQPEFAHAQGQIPIGTGLGCINQNAARAIHGLDRIIFPVDHRGIHIVFIVIPVSGSLPQAPVEDDRSGDLHIARFCMDLSPVIQQGIFQNHPLGQKERESRAGLVHHEQAQFPAQLSVVTLFGLFHHGDVSFQLFLFGERGRIQSGEHLVVLVASPVRAGQAHDLKRFSHAFGAHQMRARAQIHELALAVKADFGVLREILDQLHLVGLILFLHIGNSLVPGLGETLDFQIFLYDFLHLRFDLLKIVAGERGFEIHIIVETVRDGRADGQFRIGIEPLYRLGHHMARRMAQRSQSFLVSGSEDVHLRIPIYHRAQIHHFAVHFAGAGRPGKPFAQIRGDFDDGHRAIIFFDRTIFQCNLHLLSLLFSWPFLMTSHSGHGMQNLCISRNPPYKKSHELPYRSPWDVIHAVPPILHPVPPCGRNASR